MSHAVGRLCEQPLAAPISRAVERAYVRAYAVDMSEVEPQAGAYPSFDAFFTRPLRPGARRVEDGRVVSPADGRLVDAGPVRNGRRILVKGKPYSVAELVGGEEEGALYAGGSFAVVYLSPRDYHRVHSPVDGEIDRIRSIPGDLYPVNSVGERHIPRLFTRNERVAVFVNSERVGRVAIVLVGALIVGRISVTSLGSGRVAPGDHPPQGSRTIHRGDEVGRFHLGSTVVLLTADSTAFSRTSGPVRYGEVLVPGP